MAEEINKVKGGQKGVTGPTLFRYAKGSSRPRNEMLREFVLTAIDQLESSGGSVVDEILTSNHPQSISNHEKQIDAYYQDFYQKSPIMMHSVARDGRLISVNEFWLSKMGYEWHEVIGRRSTDFLTAESRQLVKDIYWPQLIENRSVSDLSLQFVRKDGEILDVLLSCEATEDSAGELDFTFAVLVDISNLKRESLELQTWKSLVENAPDFILTIARDGTILYCNKILPGFTREDIVGKSVYSFIDASYLKEYEEAIEQAFETGEPCVLQTLAQGAHQEPAWYEAHIGGLEHNGKVIAATIIGSDITDRKNQEQHYQMLFEQNISGVFRSSIEGELLDCNDAFAEILGYESRSDLINGSVMSFYHSPQDREPYIGELKRQGSVKNFEVRHKKRDGSTVWVLANSSLVKDELGVETIVLGTILDVTAKKQLEERLLQQNEYLNALHDTALGVLSHMDLDELLEAIITRAGSLVGSPHGFIYLTDASTDVMSVDFATGELRQFIGAQTKLGEGLAGRVWHTGRAMVIDDYLSWAGRLDVRAYDMIRSIIGVPLKSGHRVIGVIGLVDTEIAGKFGEAETAVLTQFSELASIALDNVRLYERLEDQLVERKEYMRSLNESVESALKVIRHASKRIEVEEEIADVVKTSAETISAQVDEAFSALQNATESPP